MLVPWRFLVIAPRAGKRLSALALKRGSALGIEEEKCRKVARMFAHAPLIVAVVFTPKESEKAPKWEQRLTNGAVCLSLLNAALAAGWGANWLTGWVAQDRGFLEEGLGLAPGEGLSGQPRLRIVIEAFRLALGQLTDPRMIAIVLRAVGLTILLTAPLWLVLLIIAGLLEFLLPAHLTLPFIGEVGFLGLFTKGLFSKASWAFWTYVIAPLSLALAGFFLDRIVDLVEARHYPGQPAPRRMSPGETIAYSLRFLGFTIAISLASIAAGWFFAPLAPVIYVLANGTLIAREYMETVALRRIERLRRRPHPIEPVQITDRDPAAQDDAGDDAPENHGDDRRIACRAPGAEIGRRAGMGTFDDIPVLGLRARTQLKDDEKHQEPDHGKQHQGGGDRHRSGLLELDQGAVEIPGMQEEHRLAMRADLRLTPAEHPRAGSEQVIACGDDVIHLIADVMDAARRVLLEKAPDRACIAERFEKLDLGIGQASRDSGAPLPPDPARQSRRD